MTKDEEIAALRAERVVLRAMLRDALRLAAGLLAASDLQDLPSVQRAMKIVAKAQATLERRERT